MNETVGTGTSVDRSFCGSAGRMPAAVVGRRTGGTVEICCNIAGRRTGGASLRSANAAGACRRADATAAAGQGAISPVRGVICEDGRDSGRLRAFGSERMVPKKRPIVALAAATARREAMRRAGPRPMEPTRAWTDLSTGRRKMSDCAAVARHSDRKAGRVACIYNCSADSPDTRLRSADPDATAAAEQGGGERVFSGVAPCIRGGRTGFRRGRCDC